MFQNSSRRRAVCKELGAVLLGGNGEADSVLGHGDGAVAYEAVEAEAGDVEYILRGQYHGTLLHVRAVVRLHLIGVPAHRPSCGNPSLPAGRWRLQAPDKGPSLYLR